MVTTEGAMGKNGLKLTATNEAQRAAPDKSMGVHLRQAAPELLHLAGRCYSFLAPSISPANVIPNYLPPPSLAIPECSIGFEWL